MSIRTRLIFWYTGLLAVSLLFFGALIFSLLASILTTVMDSRLASQAEAVISLIQKENDPGALMLSGRLRLPATNVFASQYFIEIVGADGEAVQLSENLQGQRLPMPTGIASDIASGGTHAYTIETGGGTRLRVASVPFVVGGRPVGAVLVAQSLADLDAGLMVVRTALLIGALTSLLLAAVGGVILARAALRPIQVITTTAQQITQAQDLSQRIPVAVPNDEVGRLTSTINGMLARLETLFQAQHRLVADVSHELRTPLTTIQGNLDLLRRGAVEDPAMRGDALRAIGDETGRMRRLVNDLLLLAQADTGLKLRQQPVELDTLLLEVYRQAQVMAQNVIVRLGAEDQALVLGDDDRLRQLLLNLVDNAIKYTPAGGTITLGLSRRAGWAQVTVSDTGMGIAAEDLPHIFERLYRADRSRSRSIGAGLGLSIAQWIAEAHGGRIEATSQVGKGSTFTVWLPELTSDRRPTTNDQRLTTDDG